MISPMSYEKGGIVRLLHKSLRLILYISIIGEMVFFPSLANFAGCVMSLIVWVIFSKFFLKERIMLEHPFSFFVFLSIFLARYIPLPATLVEGKPITYGFQNPLETFFYETIMFIVVSLAYYSVICKRRRHNNQLQRILYKFNFFQADSRTLWGLGLIGLMARIQNLASAGTVEYGDTGGKFLDGFLYLQYAPLIMLFPTLSGIAYSKSRNRFVWYYAVFMFILSFAANSRQQMIYPIFTIVLLFFLYVLKDKISIYRFFSPAKIVALFVVLVFGLSFLSDLSVAMLANRTIRNDIGRMELLNKTIETMKDDEMMAKLRNISIESSGSIVSYRNGWDEAYLDNFMLNRYGNMRVVDQTIYYADIIGFDNPKMKESFYNRIITIFPTPFASVLGFNIDKNSLVYSPGDMLYWVATSAHAALGGFRVTSLVGDGLATFGYWSFLIVYVLLYLSFKLIDSLVYLKKGDILFSTLGLINVFGFLGMFRNSIGIIVPLAYIMRGFWQQCFMFWIIVFILKMLPKFKKD